jgi:hypothetical protein
VTPLRLVGILALGSLAVLLGALARGDDDPLRATTEVALGYGLGIGLVVVLGVGALVWWLMRRKSSTAAAPVVNVNMPSAAQPSSVVAAFDLLRTVSPQPPSLPCVARSHCNPP